MQSRNEKCECGSGKKFKNCCMKGSETSFIKKYGYKIIILVFVCFFINAFYNKYINAEATVWCYECQRAVPESAKGHQTEPSPE